MKRKIALLLTVLMITGALTACGGNTQPSSSASPSESSAQETLSSEVTSETTEEASEGSSEVSQNTASGAEGPQDKTSSESKAESSKSQSSKAVSQQSSSASKAASTPTQTSNQQSSSVSAVSSTPAQTSNQQSSSVSAVSSTPAKPTDQQNSTVNSPNSKPAQSVPQSSKSTPSSQTVTSKSAVTSTQPAPQQSSTQTETKPAQTVSQDIGGQALYNKLFSLDNKVTIEVTMAQSEIEKMSNDYKKYKAKNSKSPIYRKADVVITVDGTKYTIPEVGIRPKGNMSLKGIYDSKTGKLNLCHYKLSFAETFDDKDYYGSDAKVWASKDERKARKNRLFATLKKLDVKWNLSYDETYIREIYAAEMFRQSGVLVQKIGLSQLKFNGENYGVMKIYETIDKTFLSRYLPESALGGDLYKVGWTNSPANYVSGQVSIGVENNETGAKYNFNLKTNEKTSKHESLKNLIKVINSKPSLAQLEQVVDTDQFTKFLAAYYFAGDPDDIRNNYNNHYVYFRKDNGKAIFIPYDNDRTLGVTWGFNPDNAGMTSVSPYSMRAVGNNQDQANPLIKMAVRDNGIIRDKFTACLKKTASLSLWDNAAFEKEYYKAKSLYEGSVTPTVSFANQKTSFKFSLDGKYPSGDNANMSFKEYLKRIMKTYNTYVK